MRARAAPLGAAGGRAARRRCRRLRRSSRTRPRWRLALRARPGSRARCSRSLRPTRCRGRTGWRRCPRRCWWIPAGMWSSAASAGMRRALRLCSTKPGGAPARMRRRLEVTREPPLVKPGCAAKSSYDASTIALLDARGDELEEMFARDWSDGLPVVPPTRERVAAMLGGRDPQRRARGGPARRGSRRRSSAWPHARCWPVAGRTTSRWWWQPWRPRWIRRSTSTGKPSRPSRRVSSSSSTDRSGTRSASTPAWAPWDRVRGRI